VIASPPVGMGDRWFVWKQAQLSRRIGGLIVGRGVRGRRRRRVDEPEVARAGRRAATGSGLWGPGFAI